MTIPGRTEQQATGRVWVGLSGYSYPEWRGGFYPKGLAQNRWLAHAAAHFDSIELNGTFYSLKSPKVFHNWARAAPAPGFVYAVKGPRFITHDKKLHDVAAPLANFYASGVLALGEATGPFLWQLPPGLAFHEVQIAAFLDLLPRSAGDAEILARGHDEHLTQGALVEAAAPCRYRHAFEIRHTSFLTPAFYRLLAQRGDALVIADSAGHHPVVEEMTADFVYVRLHGSEELYRSRYEDEELGSWADRVAAFARGGRDVYVYFDNTALGHAPTDAQRLVAMLDVRGIPRPVTRPGAQRTLFDV